MNDVPYTAPYARHLFFCAGAYCESQGKARALYESLPDLLGDPGHWKNPGRVRRGVTPCLGVCMSGPLLVVYPEGIWYHHVGEELLKRIIDEHLRNNRPADDALFYRLDPTEGD